MSGVDELLDAVRAGEEDRVAGLLASEPSLARARMPQGVSAILLACYVGRPAIAARLADAAGELDAFEAAAVGRVDALRAALQSEPSAARAFSSDGFTALHFAAWLGHRDAVAVLLDAGADVGVVARNGMKVQPLHSAASARHAPIVALLLARGADPNARQQGGVMPLHSSAHGGDPESVRLLLKAGADPAAAADDGRTPLDFARDTPRADLVVPMIEAALAG